ncbi:MAG TPA: glycosyltransferase [Candidatus Sulfotelmatobacter sp.]|nr:glycosyltransferase [Candidatus Sulfotelmatobacter sp.]
MRVLFVVRPNTPERRGGDTTVADGAAVALRAAGLEVTISADREPDPRGYDVAHLFGIFEPETQQPQIDALRRHGVPLVISPIWWDRSGLFALGPRLIRVLNDRDPRRIERRIKRFQDDERKLTARVGKGAERRLARQAAMLAAADVVVTASELESFVCARGLRVVEPPYVVAKYGLERDAFVPWATRRAGVVCVGRIERLKNQAMLLFALRDLDVDVTLVGRSYEDEYLAVTRRWATARTHFVDRLPIDELRDLLARSAVHVLPSWADLPGMASLEAAAAGARIVVGNRGSEREYVDNEAEYADALDPAGIRAAVMRALERGPREPGDALEQRLRATRWEDYAARVAAAYRLASSARA